MRVLVTGANGFIGKNLVVRLRTLPDIEIVEFLHGESEGMLVDKVAASDFVFHLAGTNRSPDSSAFVTGNVGLAEVIANAIATSGRSIPVLFTSSTQAGNASEYGRTKLAAEVALTNLAAQCGVPVYLYRLPNVFGKWSRPNYNSVVATFCNNIVHGLPIRIDDPSVPLRLVYVDDVIAAFIAKLGLSETGKADCDVSPVYDITVGALAERIQGFRHLRDTHSIDHVGTGLTRALYATYLSHYRPEHFAYGLKVHADPRGRFAEVVRTPDSGQFSFFTAGEGVTRGGHYHHTKNEKFLVLKGEALFRFRQIATGETYDLQTSDAVPTVVETVPGWAHDITNVGKGEMIVMLWANEIFDPGQPDTYASAVIS